MTNNDRLTTAQARDQDELEAIEKMLTFERDWPPQDPATEDGPMTIARWGQDEFDDPTGGYRNMAEGGLRAFGADSARDYPIIAERAGNLEAWGFTHADPTEKSRFYSNQDGNGLVQCTPYDDYEHRSAQFLADYLQSEKDNGIPDYNSGVSALEGYCEFGGDGDEAFRNTDADYDRDHSRMTLVNMFAKAREERTIDEPITVVRGATMPEDWPGTADEYFASALPAGSRVDMLGLTSTTADPEVAQQFSNQSWQPLVYAIRTDEGIAVRSIEFVSESEVVIGPDTRFRVVGHETRGVANNPTVYLVAEKIVAREQNRADRQRM